MPRSESFDYNNYPGVPGGLETVSVDDDLTYSGVKGFVPAVDGTIAVDMEDGSSGTIVVKAGIVYPGSYTKFKSTGTTDVTGVTIFY